MILKIIIFDFSALLMSKDRIFGIALTLIPIIVILLVFELFNVSDIYGDLVSGRNALIETSTTITSKVKAIELHKTALLGQEIKTELLIIKSLLVLFAGLFIACLYFYNRSDSSPNEVLNFLNDDENLYNAKDIIKP